jgi:uncharacterized protein (DUF1330 family)
MNNLVIAGLGVVAGIAIGAAATQGLQAQTSAPVFYVSESTVKDQTGYAPIQAKIREATKQSTGKFLAQASKTVAIEGEASVTTATIVQFKNMDDAKKVYLSPAMKKLFDERKPFVTGRSFLVEGLAN